MNERFLPIGTVVLLKNAEKKIMITSYLIFTNGENKNIFDYGGCTFPEGVIESNYTIGFNHSEIDKVLHLGLVDDEQKELNKALIGSEEEIKNKIRTDVFKEEA